MLGIILLIVGLAGLVLTLMSLFGLDFGDFDVHPGDSGVGLLSVLMPFLTGFGLIGGGLIVFGDGVTSASALIIGGGVGLGLALAAAIILKWLLGAGQEVPRHELIGLPVRVVDPVSPGRLGTGEVATPLGSQRITLSADQDFARNDRVRIITKVDGRNVYVVERLPYSELDP